MLAEAVLEGASKLRNPSGERTIRPSGMSICPVNTYNNWKGIREPSTNQTLLIMNDGHYQEEEMKADLRRAGFQIDCREDSEGNQLPLHIGPMIGHLDGLIKTHGEWCLLECKGMNTRRFNRFKEHGFQMEPGIRVQTQLYLHSDELRDMGITKGFVYAKGKDHCRPYDLQFDYEPQFAKALVEQAKKLLDGWIPKPVRIPMCSDCRRSIDCWETFNIDFSKVGSASLPELVEKWKKGTRFRDFGKTLVKEAREAFEEELGDLNLVIIDDLKVIRSEFTRESFNADKFIELYGVENLYKVLDNVPVSQMRVYEIG